MTLGIEAAACLFWFVYSSFFEWFGHRYFMHARRFPLIWLFNVHTFVHHQIYKGDRFQTRVSGRPSHVIMQPFSFPCILLGHLPVFAFFQWLTRLPTFWGAVMGGTFYYAAYEYTHFLMHVPRGHFVERFRWFWFLREHHRLHHRYMLRNFNVLVPLGDLCFRTLVTASGTYSKPVQRQRRLARRIDNSRPSAL